jgi:hypothetical protein
MVWADPHHQDKPSEEKMGRKTWLGAAVLLAALAGSILSLANAAERPKAVVELFTSQGCSSCPPADRVLAELAERDDIVALAYHIDYWDYLGWKDTLAQPDNTARQRDYARALHARSVYTPQAVINGRMHMNGARRDQILSAIEQLAATGQGLSVEVTLARRDDSLVIEAGKASDWRQKGHLLLVYYNPQVTVTIERGENAGRTLTYRNAVTAFQAAGMWYGKAARWEIPASELERSGGGCAVLLQAMGKDGLPGPVLGAAILEPTNTN